MGKAARDHVVGRFSWDRTFTTLLGEVYPKALAARAALPASGKAALARSPAA
jgi:hypothetical protein